MSMSTGKVQEVLSNSASSLMHTPSLQPVLLAVVSKHMATILFSNPLLLISAKHASDMTAAVPDLSLGMANSLVTSLPDTIIVNIGYYNRLVDARCLR